MTDESANTAAGREDAWHRPARKFDRAPILRGRPVVRAGFDATAITASAVKPVVLGLLLTIAGPGVAVAIWAGWARFPGRAAVLVVGGPVALLLSLVGLSLCCIEGGCPGRDLAVSCGFATA